LSGSGLVPGCEAERGIVRDEGAAAGNREAGEECHWGEGETGEGTA